MLLVVPILFILAWLLAGKLMSGLRSQIISSPWSIVTTLSDQLDSSELWDNVGVTLFEFMVAFVIAQCGAIGVGLLLFSSKRAMRLLEPFFYAIYSVPKVALYPILLIVFGLTGKTIIALGVMQGFYPAFFATLGGLKAVSPLYLELARSLEASRRQTYQKVVLRAAVGPIIAGSRVSSLMCFHGVITGEIISGERGLGYVVLNHYQNFAYPQMYAYIIVTGVVVMVVYFATNIAEKKLMKLTGGR